MKQAVDRTLTRRIRWVLAIVTILLYAWCVLNSDFIGFDDNDYVMSNPHVRGGLGIENFFWAFGTFHSGNWHPVTWLSHMLDCTLSDTLLPLNHALFPPLHHLTNVVFHTATTVLLFGLLLRMTGAVWRSALVAALFAWHPVHVESVAWVAERKDVLCAFFGVLSLSAYWRYVSERKDEPLANDRNYRWALVWFALGVMSKPMLVTLPFVMLLLDYWPLRRLAGSWFQWNQGLTPGMPILPKFPLVQLALEKALFFAIAFVSCVLTFLAQKSAGAVANVVALPVSERLPHVAVAYARYLGKAFYPTDLSIFYPFLRPIPTLTILLSMVLLAALTILVFRLARRSPYLVTGWFWFLGMLVPTIGIVQVGAQAIADRYTYLPLIGIFIIVAWSLAEVVARQPSLKMAVSSFVAAVLAILICVAWVQTTYWSNTLKLFTHAESVTPLNEVVEAILSQQYVDASQLKEARLHAEQALKLDPNHPEINFLMGKLALYEGKTNEALRLFEQTLEAKPNYAAPRYSLANLLAAQNRFEEATNQYELALRSDREIPALEYNYGVVLARMADRETVLKARGKMLNLAGTHLKAALRLRPQYPEALDQLAAIETKFGDLPAAEKRYRQALEADPNYTHSHLKLGYLLASQKKFDEAMAHLFQVVRAEPTNFLGHFNLACVYESIGRNSDAAAEFATAAKLEPGDAEAQTRLAVNLSTLGKPEAAEAHRKSAGLLARDGRFKEAIEACRKALKLNPNSTETLANLAWLLATCPRSELRNGAEAVTLAERACELGGRKDARYLMSLDAAYAEANRFPEAIQTAEQSLAVAKAANQPQLVDAATRRLEAYRAGKPFHLPGVAGEPEPKPLAR